MRILNFGKWLLKEEEISQHNFTPRSGKIERASLFDPADKKRAHFMLRHMWAPYIQYYESQMKATDQELEAIRIAFLSEAKNTRPGLYLKPGVPEAQTGRAAHFLRTPMHDTLRKHLGIQDTGTINLVNHDVNNQEQARSITYAQEFLKGILSKAIAREQNISIKANKDTETAMASPKKGILTGPQMTGDPLTLIHEIGHMLYYSNMERLEPLVCGFIASMARGQTLQKHPQTNDYVVPSIAINRFLGRSSYGGTVRMGTEILSVGLEKLYGNPIEFATENPEYFKLIIGIITGKLPK